MSVLEEEEEACVLDVGNVVTCTLKVGGVGGGCWCGGDGSSGDISVYSSCLFVL